MGGYISADKGDQEGRPLRDHRSAMAGLFDMQADVYADARPSYPADWFANLASLTPHHALAWDAGTGSGQAALGVSFSCPQPVPPSSSYETKME